MENTLPDFLIDEEPVESVESVEPVEAKVLGLEKPIRLGIVDKQIEKYREDYLGLTIQGPDDKAGFKRVYEARQVVKKARTSVDKKRKELTEDARKFTTRVNEEAKRITALLLPIETHLESQEVAYERERERIRMEKELAQQRLVETRVTRLRALDVLYSSETDTFTQYGSHALTLEDIKALSDNDFEDVALSLEETYHTEQARLAELKRQQEAEAARIAAEQAEAARKLEELKRQQAEAEAELKRQQAELLRQQEEAAAEIRRQQQELDNLKRQQDEEKARIEAERKQAEAEAAEAARKEALKPDKEKLVRLAEILDTLDYPYMSTEEGQEMLRSTVYRIGEISESIRQRVESL